MDDEEMDDEEMDDEEMEKVESLFLQSGQGIHSNHSPLVLRLCENFFRPMGRAAELSCRRSIFSLY